MFIIIFQYVTTGNTQVSEECFKQIDITNFLSNTSLSPGIRAVLKLTKNIGLAVTKSGTRNNCVVQPCYMRQKYKHLMIIFMVTPCIKQC